MKTYNIQYNIGKAKYCLNYHDGQKTYKDGSPFYDIATFKSKKALNSKITELEKDGYKYKLFDYFKKPELIPDQVKAILGEHDEDGDPYIELAKTQSKLNQINWDFEWYLDAEAFHLHPMEKAN